MTVDATASTRDRVLRAAADLLEEGGREAVSTRAVSAAAGVQAPTLYRLFGDKEGLLDAVAAYGFERYLAEKAGVGESGDPVDDLRRGWETHLTFGLSHPAFYTLMYGDVRPGVTSPAAREAAAVLRRMLSRIAAAGRLKMDVERAARLTEAAGRGVTLNLIETPPEDRDPHLSTLTRDAVFTAILTDPPASGPAHPRPSDDAMASHALALQAALTGRRTPLTPAEQSLLTEWLTRLTR
ncbi:TetR/AcrR family transcriptional regulator [Sphaerisporangium sp. TRM90804]|uniref:TetR/AcrR family transcriptional regulator n=1 Tax=Sphaerisporangium sp. TRM90804 TaxID=3031113 RepID=UPI00244B1AFE|nr:TetR/AcrR family transcriptional regulator [Sphaerisporangium sp. TRM90804]MDH2424421.1 TetR/AcrR family transcriptional regulator [Sphaerisporangium sp. TRM90804]